MKHIDTCMCEVHVMCMRVCVYVYMLMRVCVCELCVCVCAWTCVYIQVCAVSWGQGSGFANACAVGWVWMLCAYARASGFVKKTPAQKQLRRKKKTVQQKKHAALVWYVCVCVNCVVYIWVRVFLQMRIISWAEAVGMVMCLCADACGCCGLQNKKSGAKQNCAGKKKPCSVGVLCVYEGMLYGCPLLLFCRNTILLNVPVNSQQIPGTPVHKHKLQNKQDIEFMSSLLPHPTQEGPIYRGF